MSTGNEKPRFIGSSVKLERPTMMCVNMTYDPGPFTQHERLAVRTFIDSVGGLERAQCVLRELGNVSGG